MEVTPSTAHTFPYKEVTILVTMPMILMIKINFSNSNDWKGPVQDVSLLVAKGTNPNKHALSLYRLLCWIEWKRTVLYLDIVVVRRTEICER